MRSVPAALVTVALGACAGGTNLQPVDLSAPAPASTEVTMECVTRELDDFGYEVSANQTEPGSVTGIRINERIWFVEWLYGDSADQITATIDDGQLRVTALSSDPNEVGDLGPPTRGASEAATRNAESILETCGST